MMMMMMMMWGDADGWLIDKRRNASVRILVAALACFKGRRARSQKRGWRGWRGMEYQVVDNQIIDQSIKVNLHANLWLAMS